MTKKLNKRKLQAQNTYEKIYNAAMTMVEKKGFDNITVEDICKKAGVSVGSFYNYFKSKQDILNETFKIADNYFKNKVANDLPGRNLKEKIVRYFAHYAEFCANHELNQLKQIYSTSNTNFIKKGRYMQAVLMDILEEGKKSGELQTDMEIDEIVDYLFIALRGVIFDWCLHNGEYDLVEFATNYTRRLLKGLDI